MEACFLDGWVLKLAIITPQGWQYRILKISHTLDRVSASKSYPVANAVYRQAVTHIVCIQKLLVHTGLASSENTCTICTEMTCFQMDIEVLILVLDNCTDGRCIFLWGPLCHQSVLKVSQIWHTAGVQRVVLCLQCLLTHPQVQNKMLHLRQAGVSQSVKKKLQKYTDRTNHTTKAIANNVARGLLSESMVVQNVNRFDIRSSM